ncbi:AraC family transcriptional regulator [Ramlibacter tataouinensis]|uniref:AraC family transcriptional regulator n=1 Tax=Ramlibacter tataouinensis TaxID=94132 RepID=UPI0013147D1B|nr:AraC family transcriptional regulator [Ramlibacter tataouinensis]
MAEVATHSSAWVRGVLSLFATQGAETAWLLHEAGIDPARLAAAHGRFAIEDVDRLWTLALARTGQATLGLDRPLARRHIYFDLAVRAMWSSRDLDSALAVLSQYLALIHDAAAFRMVPERGGHWLVFDDAGAGPSPRQRIEFMMLALHLLCQHVTRHRVRLLAADFVFPEPADLHPYRMAFHCPLRFGQAANRLLVGKEDLALPVAGQGESLFAVQDRVIEDRLARLAGARTTYRASEEIVRRLHLGEPRRADLARSLGLTDRALASTLRAEGHTFEQLLDDVRKDLAAQYLGLPGYETAQVANLLGWETAAQLAGACKRWFGAGTDELPRSMAARGKSLR